MSPAALGRLLRISLAPTAIADVAAGIAISGAPSSSWASSAPWTLIVASLCVYHGGMALNDWADREEDSKVRPDRPIPSGKIPAAGALALSIGLLVLGPALAWSVSSTSAIVLSAVAVGAAGYDLTGRGPWLGPLLLALCRAGNLTTGLLIDVPFDVDRELVQLLGSPLTWGVFGYGAYVFVVSRLGRLEDNAQRLADHPARPRRLLLAAAALLALPAVFILMLGFQSAPQAGWAAYEHGFTSLDPPNVGQQLLAYRPFLGILIGLGAALQLVRTALGTSEWTPGKVMGAMGMCLRRLLVYTATLAMGLTFGADAVGVLLLLGYPLSHALRKVSPPS